MNLMAAVAGSITAINPYVTVVLSVSTGSIQTPDYRRIPTYNNFPVQAQIQALSNKDLRQLDGVNLGGEIRAIYLYGDVEGVVRAMQKGGDVITTSDGTEFLVTQVLETWGVGWCKIAATQQTKVVA
jgi:hypothetical protein